MSEYVTVTPERTDDPDVMEIIVNQTLTHEDEEVYANRAVGDVGSPIAQMLFAGIRGIRALTIVEDALIITRDPAVQWEEIIDEVRDALRDFFL
jgi:hypothetical protein